MVRKGGQQLYTRDGTLNFDALGRLTTSDGAVLQGWTADANGTVNANAAVGDISMPLGQTHRPDRRRPTSSSAATSRPTPPSARRS